MKAKEDLSGQKFGRLKVIKKSDKRYRDKSSMWECQCDCGNMVTCLGRNLKNGITRSCGCLRRELSSKRELEDLTGQRFSRLTVIERSNDYVSPGGRKQPQWRCRCDCGNETIVIAGLLKSGAVKSCGCLRTQITDLTGKTFGELKVISFSHKKGKHSFFKCQCSCGATVEVNASSLVQGLTVSCGHIQKMRSKENRAQNQENIFVENTTLYAALPQKVAKNNTSGYTGVMKRKNKWMAYITFQKKRYFLGYYTDILDAVKARKQAEDRLHGDFLDWYAQEYPESWERIIKRKNTESEV